MLYGNYYYQARDIIGFGWPLTIDTVREAYGKGVFPWHIDGMPLPWFCPENRAVLNFEDLHVSRSLRKFQRNTSFRVSIDEAFEDVVLACAETPRAGQDGTWITEEYLEAFVELNRLGDTHSFEVWEGKELVGGLYGIDAGGLFCGESMFFKRPNASKLALITAVEHLREHGSDWLDIQVMTAHMEKFGAIEIPRSEFLDRLTKTQEQGLRLF